jgi:protein TonB
MRLPPLAILLLLPAFAAAQTASRTAPYSPKFARVAQAPEVLAWDLCPEPTYPKSSARNEETGTVTLRFTVAPTGRMIDSKLAGSSGFRDLDRAAFGALSRCRFRPASIDGVPVQMSMFVQYVWRLE